MRKNTEGLSDRLLSFAAAVVKLVNRLPKAAAGRHVANQLLRAGTSSAANYEEACAAESRADFIHKLHLSLKELRESRFWLRLIARAELMPQTEYESVLDEAEQLCKIIAKSLITAKSKKPT